MKRTALALHHLVSTRFRSDALQIIAFGRHARTLSAAELTGQLELAVQSLLDSLSVAVPERAGEEQSHA